MTPVPDFIVAIRRRIGHDPLWCTWVSGEAHVADDESTDVRWWPVAALPPMRPQMVARVEAVLSDEREARFVR